MSSHTKRYKNLSHKKEIQKVAKHKTNILILLERSFTTSEIEGRKEVLKTSTGKDLRRLKYKSSYDILWISRSPNSLFSP